MHLQGGDLAMADEHIPDRGMSEQPTDSSTTEHRRRRLPAEAPFEQDGACSRCGGRWPCLRCLTSTPPYVPVQNNC